MLSTSALYQAIHSVSKLSDSDWLQVEACLKARLVKKKKNALDQGDVCRWIAYIESRCMRSYSIDDKGAEHVVQLAMEGHWISDLYSFATQTPATLSLEALEDTSLQLLP